MFRLAQSPPASRPNPAEPGLSRSAAQARKRASGRAHRLRELPLDLEIGRRPPPGGCVPIFVSCRVGSALL